MGHDISSGSVCYDFCHSHKDLNAVVQLSADEYVVYGRLTTIDESLSLTRLGLWRFLYHS